MEFDDFAERFRGVLERGGGVDLRPGSVMREFEEWDSLTAVSTLAMILGEYDVEIRGEELKAIITLGDLYERVRAGLPKGSA